MVAEITDIVSNKEFYNLVGDIGGTNARFAIVPVGSSELMSIKTLHCEKFETIQKAIQFYLSSIEDIQYHLYVLEKIKKGQQQIRDGKGIWIHFLSSA